MVCSSLIRDTSASVSLSVTRGLGIDVAGVAGTNAVSSICGDGD